MDDKLVKGYSCSKTEGAYYNKDAVTHLQSLLSNYSDSPELFI